MPDFPIRFGERGTYMKRPCFIWFPFAVLALMAAPSAWAQQTAQPKAECGSFTKESTQLPCVPNRIAVIYPTALDAEFGRWEARDVDGARVAVEVQVMNGSRGVTVFGRERLQGGCTTGTVDLADACALWKPGRYLFHWVASDGTPRIGPIRLEIRQPQGQDKTVFDTLIMPRISGPLQGGTLLGWVYSTLPSVASRPPVMDRVLAEFPDSEYAGYFLVKRGGSGSLEWAARFPSQSAEQRDRHWAIPEAATPDRQEQIRQEYRRSYTDFANKGQRYLDLYPAFPEAALLHFEMAWTLFNLDRSEEALREVEACAKLTGPFAEEAKVFLAARPAKNAPAPATPGQAKAPEAPPAKEQPKS